MSDRVLLLYVVLRMERAAEASTYDSDDIVEKLCDDNEKWVIICLVRMPKWPWT